MYLKKTFWLLAAVLLPVMCLSGCYCLQRQSSGGSVRFLTGGSGYSLCFDPPGLKDGKVLHTTVYTADPYGERQRFRREYGSGVSFSQQALVGLRAQVYRRLGVFPGPVVGLGLDYAWTGFTARYTTVAGMDVQARVRMQRWCADVRLVTWIRHRLMGYACVQSGIGQVREAGGTCWDWNWRLGYGLDFYIHPLINLSLELGYGTGAYARAGIGFWMF